MGINVLKSAGYTSIRERVVNGDNADRALMNYVVILKDLRGMLLDVNVLIGAAGNE